MKTNINGRILKAYVVGIDANEHEAMMMLRDAGCISDNCIGLVDIANEDATIALNHLKIWNQTRNERN